MEKVREAQPKITIPVAVITDAEWEDATEEQEANRSHGRKTLYKSTYDEQTYRFCLLGATDEEIAGFFNVSVRTIHAWKNAHPTFLHALNLGRQSVRQQSNKGGQREPVKLRN